MRDVNIREAVLFFPAQRAENLEKATFSRGMENFGYGSPSGRRVLIRPDQD